MLHSEVLHKTVKYCTKTVKYCTKTVKYCTKTVKWAILSGAPVPVPQARSTGTAADPFVYFVQAGAFSRTEEAEQQKARLALMGHGARITEREQAGRVVYRVRIGPFPTRDEADATQVKLQGAGVESQIVRVEKP